MRETERERERGLLHSDEVFKYYEKTKVHRHKNKTTKTIRKKYSQNWNI